MRGGTGSSLDPRWSIVPVGGADAVPTFVALLGGHLDVTVLLDSRREGHQRLNRLTTEGQLAKHRIILVGELLGRKLGDLEDLFEVGEYLELYNRAFKTAEKGKSAGVPTIGSVPEPRLPVRDMRDPGSLRGSPPG